MKSRLKDRRFQHLILEEEEEQKGSSFVWVNEMDRVFKENIEKKICFIQALTKKGQAQRCFDHNIPYSLYCTHCRRFICASCMYNSQIHKKHRVQPLQSSTKEIKDDIDNMIYKLVNKLKTCQTIANEANSRIMQFNRDFENSIFELNRFYDDLFEMVKQKREEQKKVIRQHQEAVNLELKSYIRTTSQIKIYLYEKFRTYGNSSVRLELLIPSKGILEVLN